MKYFKKSRGQSTFMLIGIVTIICIMMIGVYQTVSKINTNSAGSHKARDIAIQAADGGINQFISDVSNRKVDVLGASLPFTRNYPVQIGSNMITVPVSINYATSTAGVTLKDLEGNFKYVVDAIATPVIAYGAGVKNPVTRHIQANMSIVNLARYNAFKFQNAAYYVPDSDFNGPYHCNGTVLSIAGTAYWNSKTDSTGAVNPFYYDDYVTMVAGTFVQYGGMAPDFNTNVADHGRISSDGSYSICATASKPEGTWIDSAHKGSKIAVRPIPYGTYYNYAQVIIQKSDLPNYILNGATVSSSSLTINPGVGASGANYVNINISAFGTGSADDVFKGLANYTAALTSTYGIVIYTSDDVCVSGRLPAVAGATNTNKKLMIVSQKSIEMIGDILYSGDTYAAGADTYSAALTIPSSISSNPTNDAIALICTDNIYINPWRKSFSAYFKNTDDMKIDAFLYGYSGAIGGGGRTYQTLAGYSGSNMTRVTSYGGQTFDHSGPPAANELKLCFDRDLANNISKLVPVGVGVISWMEIQ